MTLSKSKIKQVLSRPDTWSIGNQTLYDLCTRHPDHTNDSAIVAKVWLIGRAYSAALERGRGRAATGDASNDRFYTEVVSTALRASQLDERLDSLRSFKASEGRRVTEAIRTHGYLLDVFRTLTNKSKRSLASKYLHFHLPELFFIYDSRAAAMIRALGSVPVPIDVPQGADREYSRFVASAVALQKRIHEKFGLALTPRQLDRILLEGFEIRAVQPRRADDGGV